MPLAEGEVGRVTPPNHITFTPVTSCFTVKVTLAGGDEAGAHFSLMTTGAANSFPSDQLLAQLVAAIGGTAITRVDLGGYGDMWSPAYLNLPKMQGNGTPNYNDVQEQALARGMSEMAVPILTALNFFDATAVFYHQAR